MKTRSHTIEAAVANLRSAAADLPQPPAHVTLSASERPYWNALMRSRCADDWSDLDLHVAAHLTRCLADIHEQQAVLDVEGNVITTDSGRRAVNPRFTAMDVMVKRQMLLMRRLRLVGSHARVEAGRRRAAGRATRTLDELKGDDYLTHWQIGLQARARPAGMSGGLPADDRGAGVDLACLHSGPHV